MITIGAARKDEDDNRDSDTPVQFSHVIIGAIPYLTAALEGSVCTPSGCLCVSTSAPLPMDGNIPSRERGARPLEAATLL